MQKLDNEEWRELVSFYRSQDLTPPTVFFKLAAKHLEEKHIGDLIFLLIENENHLNDKSVMELSGDIVLKNDPEKIHFFMRHDYMQRFLMLALDNNSPQINDTVARISFLSLRQHQQVILRLSKHFWDLSLKSQRNFLLSSYQTEFEGKLELFNSILETEKLDDISFEAVVAGLCTTNDHSTLERLAAIGDDLEKNDRLGAFGRGIVLGSRDEAINFFKNYKWKNRVIEILRDVMGKNDSEYEEPKE